MLLGGMSVDGRTPTAKDMAMPGAFPYSTNSAANSDLTLGKFESSGRKSKYIYCFRLEVNSFYQSSGPARGPSGWRAYPHLFLQRLSCSLSLGGDFLPASPPSVF